MWSSTTLVAQSSTPHSPTPARRRSSPAHAALHRLHLAHDLCKDAAPLDGRRQPSRERRRALHRRLIAAPLALDVADLARSLARASRQRKQCTAAAQHPGAQPACARGTARGRRRAERRRRRRPPSVGVEPAHDQERTGAACGRGASLSLSFLGQRAGADSPLARPQEHDHHDHHHQPTTLFAARTTIPTRKLSRSKSRSRRPSGEYARPTSPTYSHSNGYGAEPQHPPGPRKLRRKSHGAYYAAPVSASSPPASPVTSYAYAQGHGAGPRAATSPRRLPGQVVASPRGSESRDEGERERERGHGHGHGREGEKGAAARAERDGRREEQQVPLATREDPAARERNGGGPALRAPAFGPYVCELEDQDDEVTPQDRHYVARMLAKCVLPSPPLRSSAPER